jgi:hypothetical protein
VIPGVDYSTVGNDAARSERDPPKRRGVAQPGRALGSGPRGRRFKSSRPDQLSTSFQVGRLRGLSVSRGSRRDSTKSSRPDHSRLRKGPAIAGLFAVWWCAGCMSFEGFLSSVCAFSRFLPAFANLSGMADLDALTRMRWRPRLTSRRFSVSSEPPTLPSSRCVGCKHNSTPLMGRRGVLPSSRKRRRWLRASPSLRIRPRQRRALRTFSAGTTKSHPGQ